MIEFIDSVSEITIHTTEVGAAMVKVNRSAVRLTFLVVVTFDAGRETVAVTISAVISALPVIDGDGSEVVMVIKSAVIDTFFTAVTVGIGRLNARSICAR